MKSAVLHRSESLRCTWYPGKKKKARKGRQAWGSNADAITHSTITESSFCVTLLGVIFGAWDFFGAQRVAPERRVAGANLLLAVRNPPLAFLRGFQRSRQKRGVCGETGGTTWRFNKRCLFLEAHGGAHSSPSCPGVTRLGHTCPWQGNGLAGQTWGARSVSPSAKFSPPASPFCELFPEISLKIELFPLETGSSFSLESPPALPFASLAAPFFVPWFPSAASPACPPHSSSLNPFVSFHGQETVKPSWQSPSAQPCHGAYGKLHLGGLCLWFVLLVFF